MILIKLFSDFLKPCDIKPIFENAFSTQFIENYGKYKHVYITEDDDYTHAIIINTFMSLLKPDIPKSNVLGLAYEPNYKSPFLNITREFVKYAEQNIGAYYIGDLNGLSSPFIEKPAYLTHTVPIWKNSDISINSIIQNKSKIMSIVLSKKCFAPGHIYRHQLVKEILNTNLPIDIYGHGCEMYSNFNDSRLKGSFKEIEPYLDYKYHVCIENFTSNCYYSEKVINPLLYGSIPIYLGCHNIEQFLPENSIIKLSSSANDAIKQLSDIINNNEILWKVLDVEKIYDSVNLFKNIDKIFNHT